MITALHSTPRLFADDTCSFLTAKNTFELEELGNSEQRWALGTFKVLTITVQILFRKSTDGTILGTF